MLAQTKTAGGGVKLSPFLTEFPPFPFPLLLRNKESTESLKAGTLSVSQSGTFPNYATRFRGGALRHAKFPKTSYKVQLLDTLKHAACVSLNHVRRRGLIFLSKKVLILFWQNAGVLSGEGTSHSVWLVLILFLSRGFLGRLGMTTS